MAAWQLGSLLDDAEQNMRLSFIEKQMAKQEEVIEDFRFKGDSLKWVKYFLCYLQGAVVQLWVLCSRVGFGMLFEARRQAQLEVARKSCK